MSYSAFVRRLKEVAEGIEQRADMKPNMEFERPFAKAEVAELRDSMTRHGIETTDIWSEFVDLFAVVNGFLFQWLYQGSVAVSTQSGSAQISGIHQIYLPEQLPPGREKLFYGQRRVFDRISPDDQVTVRFERGQAAPIVEYFSDDTGDYHPLSLGVSEYLETLLEARATYRWQQFFVSNGSFPLAKAKAEAFRQSLQTIFPEARVDRFKAAYEN